MEEKKRELIAQALNVYKKFGIKSVTMDEMARQLGISKKTLYIHVKDKNDLVEQCVAFEHECDIGMIEDISSKGMDAVQEKIEMSRHIIRKIGEFHPSIFFDLARYHPSALKIMQNHKYDVVLGCVRENMAKGVKEKVYRENLDVDVMASIYVASIDAIMSNDHVTRGATRMDAVLSEFFRYHIRGIASKKGLKRLTELIENDENL